MIGSKIHAYFPEDGKSGEALHIKWNNFSELVTDFYEKNWDNRGGNKLHEDKAILFGIKAKIIQEVLASKITGFTKENKYFG